MAAEHVSIVDDDEAVRESVDGLLRSVGLETTAFDSAEEFLSSPHRVPIVILTAITEEDARTRALEAGAARWCS